MVTPCHRAMCSTDVNTHSPEPEPGPRGPSLPPVFRMCCVGGRSTVALTPVGPVGEGVGLNCWAPATTAQACRSRSAARPRAKNRIGDTSWVVGTA
ncbi:hypothetical protein J0H58_25415 [bacterium]|nr:hypothetical protein [bacterium]